MISRILATFLFVAATSQPLHAAPTASITKQTVSGSGTFEHGRDLRAVVNRATFHPIDNHFALSVSGRMGWVITGQWVRRGNELTLVVANMNNTPASGTGEVRLGQRGTVESVNLSGSTRGGSYKVRFKTGEVAQEPAEKPQKSPAPSSVRLGPAEPRQDAAAKVEAERESFNRTRRGSGALRYVGGTLIPLTAGDIDLSPAGRVTVRLIGGGETYEFEGVWGTAGDRSRLDLTLHPSSGENGVVTGTAHMDGSGRALDRLDLQGFRGERSFQLTFRAGR